MSFLSTKGAEGASFLRGAEQAVQPSQSSRAPESGWGWGELHVPKER